MTDFLIIRIICPRQSLAEKIGEKAVSERLAACANIDAQISSTYRWKGVVEQAFECVLWLKAPAANFDAIAGMAEKLHPYDVPAITASPITHINSAYQSWLIDNTDSLKDERV